MEYRINFDISEVDPDTVRAFNDFREAGMEVDASLPEGVSNPILDEVTRVLVENRALRGALVSPQSVFESRVASSGAYACSSVANGGDMHSIG